MRFSTSIRYSLLLILSTFLLVSACGRSLNQPDIERGSTFKYKSGHPEFRISAIGLLAQTDQPKIYLTVDVVYGSLIYKKSGDKLSASFDIEARILEKGENATLVMTKNFSKTIERTDPNIAYSQEIYSREQQIPIPAGKYEIIVSVTDRNTGKKTMRSASTYIPDPEENVLNLTSIQMLGKDMDAQHPGWSPMTTYDIQGRMDSLKFKLQVTNNKAEDPLKIDAQLIQFDSDTNMAKPMHYNNYTPSNIEYRGIEYDDRTVIQSTERLLSQPGSVIIEYKFAQQQRGNYRFVVNTSRNNGEDTKEISKARDFSIKSENYPSLQTARELARPLIYLMEEENYNQLMKITDKDSLKREVDKFWLKNIKDKNKARDVIKLYYERVEQANKQFSNYKEGWKTDPGKIYILFGPPWYTEKDINSMIWSYSYNRNNPEYNYIFRKPKLKTETYPFNNYLLQRSQLYYSVEYQQVKLWLSGRILTRGI